ncbi:MAG: cytochrome c biogenesis CcdA family protein [Candidatus Kaiserbacteria bacterium]|nr:cytochrome c biogenesis CcdA family protein [Candidatus Kaiserbacteria bacterium]
MIEQLSIVSFAVTIFAGSITVFLPCTYPMVLGYIALIIGDEDSNNIPYTLTTTSWFFTGFAVAYAIFGGVAGLFGQFSQTAVWFNQAKPTLVIIGAIFFIIVGLVLLRAVPLPEKLLGNKSFPIPKMLPVHTWWGVTLIGVIFAAGWSPCIGPVLGGVLTLAASSGSVLTGMLLLCAFAVGIMIPLTILAVLYTKAAERLQEIPKFLPIMRSIGGLLFIALGIFFLFGDLSFFSKAGPPEFLQKFL